MPNIFGIHHVARRAKGIDTVNRTIAFYHDIPGLPIVRSRGSGEEVEFFQVK